MKTKQKFACSNNQYWRSLKTKSDYYELFWILILFTTYCFYYLFILINYLFDEATLSFSTWSDAGK